MNTKIKTLIQSNFDLKRNEECLFNKTIHHANVSIIKLESIRTSKHAITASKYGLENICGISCETGAQ